MTTPDPEQPGTPRLIERAGTDEQGGPHPADQRSAVIPPPPARATPDSIYRSALAPVRGYIPTASPDLSEYTRQVMRELAPRDAVEEMLIAQLVFAHARAMRLTALACQTPSVGWQLHHEYADRASNTYRRLMLALAEYRRPPSGGDTFAIVKQTNIARQQVIQNHEGKDATNEQGCRDASGTG